jgi:hypothetical protein
MKDSDFDPDVEFLEAIDKAIISAAELLDMQDCDDDDDEYDLLLESRHHCGTCETRTVMETVWPSIENYINYLKYRTN